MRMLVTTLCASTCVAVLAAVGYFFYGEYAEAKAVNDAANRSVARAKCMRVISDAESGNVSTDKITACLLSGAIKQTDLDAAIVRIKSR